LEEKTQTVAWQVDSPRQRPCVKSSRVPYYETHYKNRPSILFTWLSPMQFLALSKIKKCLERTKICWHSAQHDVTVRYSVKRYGRLFLAVAPLSHGEYFERISSQHCTDKPILLSQVHSGI
jgi:hypothetical protein